ncbi:helix-turn-helix transcriptional regulator [Rhodocaloribacter litoris]|uniref:helix-turn-helix transcriptional regulator n=1 Tax=Rhodocaloribacter litoris TaxID=2558931 RepID=UPI00142391E6|nr:helix-turn-helix transcriptional regulator [Rhodocaloribacter litoris]QXD16888.1 helix-turn-helix transcriptional regulator [Rhodocaloribacter litoris]
MPTLDEHLRTFRRSLPPPDPAWPPEVRALVAYLHRHLFDPALRAATARQALGLRDHNVTSLFAACLGCGIRAYVNRRRVEAAQVLLRQTPAAVTEIALAVGYASLSTFHRVFRRATGLTPAAYRQAQKK